MLSDPTGIVTNVCSRAFICQERKDTLEILEKPVKKEAESFPLFIGAVTLSCLNTYVVQTAYSCLLRVGYVFAKYKVTAVTGFLISA